MSLALFFAAQHVLNASMFIFRSCDCVWVYCSGSMCVGIMVWFGWGDVVSLRRLRHYLYSTIKMMHGPINIRFFYLVNYLFIYLLNAMPAM